MIELDPYPTESEMTGYASLEERKARNSDKFIPPERPSKKQKHGDEESPGGQQDVTMTGLYAPVQPAAAPGGSTSARIRLSRACNSFTEAARDPIRLPRSRRGGGGMSRASARTCHRRIPKNVQRSCRKWDNVPSPN